MSDKSFGFSLRCDKIVSIGSGFIVCGYLWLGDKQDVAAGQEKKQTKTLTHHINTILWTHLVCIGFVQTTHVKTRLAVAVDRDKPI